MFAEVLCACCGKVIISEPYEICPVCGWEYDRSQQADPDLEGGANEMSLNQAREAYIARLEKSSEERMADEISVSESATESSFDEEN